MNGSQKVIDSLNGLLAHELAAIDQYTVQAFMLDDWGYAALHERIAHEAVDEREHVGLLISRILFLGGTPDVGSRAPLKIGATPREMIENDLAYEVEVAQMLNAAIALSRDEGDNVTRQMLEKLLFDTEHDHILWFRQQLVLMDQVGVENYLSRKL